jgi:hypothetical protein
MHGRPHGPQQDKLLPAAITTTRPFTDELGVTLNLDAVAPGPAGDRPPELIQRATGNLSRAVVGPQRSKRASESLYERPGPVWVTIAHAIYVAR